MSEQLTCNICTMSRRENRTVDKNNNQCTRMQFHLNSRANTWETCNCDVKGGLAAYFVCQKTYGNIVTNETHEIQGESDP